MKPIIKVLLTALGMTVVGKVAYEIGRDVGNIEAQLQQQTPESTTPKETHEQNPDSEQKDISEEEKADPDDSEEPPKAKREPKTALGKRLAELKSISHIKELFTRTDDSTLGKLLRNPDGAKIEASVINGEVHISVKPNTPKRE